MNNIGHLRKLIDDSSRILAFTGAGISTESGIPDYRGPDGLWTKDPDLEKKLNIHNYAKDEELRIDFWSNKCFGDFSTFEPSKGHLGLEKLYLEDRLIGVVTQNIDGLHHKTAIPANRIVEIHGTTKTSSCMDCKNQMSTDNLFLKIDLGEDIVDVITCEHCGGLMKPDAIFFGESLDPVAYHKAVSYAETCSLLIVLGSSLQVWPATDVVDIAIANDVPIVIINNQVTDYNKHAELVFYESIGSVFDQL